MSIWDTAMDDIIEHLFTDAIFTPKSGGSSSSIHARHKKFTGFQQEGSESTIGVDVQELDLILSELPRSPLKGDVVTIDSTGISYTIQIKLKDDGRFIKVSVV